MTRDQIEQWIKACEQHSELFDHERLVFRVMRECLPKELAFVPAEYVEEQQAIKGIPDGAFAKYIVAAGGKKLVGPDYERFIQFWDAFDHKSVSSRAAAAKSWMQIKDKKTPEFMEHIVAAAKHEARTRTDPAKHAQGWLTERRWEQYQQKEEVEAYTPDWWRRYLGDPTSKFMPDYRNKNWDPKTHGPNPWKSLNPKMPPEIRQEYAAWGWKE